MGDDRAEFQIHDLFSFLRFLGINARQERFPTRGRSGYFARLYIFKEEGLIERFFVTFDAELNDRGYCVQKGMVNDAHIVEVLRRRNSREERADLSRLMPAA